jgi:hypothetical protein
MRPKSNFLASQVKLHHSEACAESVQKDSSLTLKSLLRDEADIARLATEVVTLQSHSESTKTARGTHGQAHELDLSKADMGRVALEVVTVGQVRADMATLKH